MKPTAYCLLTGTIFAFVALAHMIRIALNLHLQIGASEIPMWVSWAGAAAAALIALLGFRTARG